MNIILKSPFAEGAVAGPLCPWLAWNALKAAGMAGDSVMRRSRDDEEGIHFSFISESAVETGSVNTSANNNSRDKAKE